MRSDSRSEETDVNVMVAGMGLMAEGIMEIGVIKWYFYKLTESLIHGNGVISTKVFQLYYINSEFS